MTQIKTFESDLPLIASNQVRVMMKQLAAAMNWKVDIIGLDEKKKTPILLTE